MTNLAATTTNSLHHFGPDYLAGTIRSQGSHPITASTLPAEHHSEVSATHAETQSGQPAGNNGNTDAILTKARQLAPGAFAGSVDPLDAWELVQDHSAILVDVRTHEERHFVGYIPKSLHVAWATGTQMNRNPRFVKEFESKIKNKTDVILLLCRSGKRSAAAAEALTKAGFTNVFNVREGFEGNLNASLQRGSEGGWRWHDLPWVQE